MLGIRQTALIVLTGLSLVSLAREPATGDRPNQGHKESRVRQAVTGPTRPMSEGLAAGATTIVSLQPVPPKTVPASNYPPGSAIMGQTLILGSVPARAWFEVLVTNWAPEQLKLAGIQIDATDQFGDGGGYDGDKATCDGVPMAGAGDLFPAIVSCNGGTCQGNEMIRCVSTSDCTFAGTTGPCNSLRVCQGDTSVSCHVSSDCTAAGTTGPCLNFDPVCNSQVTGRATPCGVGRCISRPPFYPPGGFVCEYAFQDSCDPRWIGTGASNTPLIDLSTINLRAADLADPGEIFIDFAPSYLVSFVLDVPANAKGTYRIDFDPMQTYLQNFGPPGNNNVPIAQLIPAVVKVACGSCCTNFAGLNATCTDGVGEAECQAMPTTNARHFRPGVTCAEADCCDCTMLSDCQDNDVCTIDACVGGCYCTHTPVAGWDPATECCHPISGMQGPIPQSSPCKVGGCSLGGSSGTPTLTTKPDGTSCASNDPCYSDGQCTAGICESEEYAGPDCPKARFISYATNTGSNMSAYRVRLVSLHHPNPPYTGAPTVDFSAHEGEVRWVGAPAAYTESSSNFNPVYGSYLQCQPHYQNWLGFEPLHVTGGEIVPSSVYQVQSIAQGLDINVESNYSAPITIATARWGETVIPYAPPSTTVQPDAGDISGILDKFKSTSRAGSKPRAMFTGPGMSGIPDMSFDVNFSDISVTVDANEGRGYPYPWPASCP